jgi:RimJ/RimL family protein N-acetyltransferase
MAISDLPIPVIETERLILRGHRLEDFDAMVGIWTDPIVQKHFHGTSLTREDIWARFLRGFGMWLVMGYGLWAVEEKATGTYVGTTGVMEVKRNMDPPMDGVPEAGWTFASQVHGKGYATEATRAALAWTDDNLARPRMFCIIAPDNAASIRVAEKCGFRLWKETTYKEAATLIFLRQL